MSDRILPAPTEVFQAGVALLGTGELSDYIGISAQRAFIGFLIGGIIGFVLGLLNGLSSIAETLFDTSLQMLRNIPHLALIPLVILWFGIEEEAKIFLVALGVLFPIYLNTFHGVKSVDKGLIEAARVYGLSGFFFILECDPSCSLSIHFGGYPLLTWNHVGHINCRRNNIR
ncbi:ABC transporter permease subunit [Peribacillus frigoritolerans]|nr:ABC transporter permease subunit [Peribacillus frigoritolerans]